jgi:cytoskeletal protein CcmA (bactofilin family)
MNDTNQNDFKGLNFTILGEGSKLKGEFEFSGELTISSEIDGKIVMRDNGKVVIERNGNVTGSIYCDTIEIFGNFSGNIKAESKVIIRSSGKLNGHILSGELAIYPGALVNIEGHTKDSL